jgi:hypothetical protein
MSKKELLTHAKALAEALEAIIASRDKLTPEREAYRGTWVGSAYVEYWSPASSQVDSEVIAKGRKVLADFENRKF